MSRCPSAATLSRFDYTYDAVRNIRTWRRQADSDSAIVWTYDYDAADQLIAAVKATTDPTPAILSAQAWAYDAAGNRTLAQVDDVVKTTTHDALNRLVTETAGGALRIAGKVSEPATVTVNGLPALVDASGRFVGSATVTPGTTTFSVAATDGSANTASQSYEVDTASATATSFTFDANGNMTSDGTRTFEWDARDQLVAVNTGTQRSEYTYDGLQRRVRIIEQEGGGIHSDDRMIWCETSICEQRDAGGTSVTRRPFTRGEQIGGAAQFFGADHLGSATEVTSSSGNLLARYAFSPWGERFVTTGSDVTTVGYTGHRTSDASALALTMFRAYDPARGRWLSEDPAGHTGGLNLYGYVANNPIKLVDPFGLAPMSSVDAAMRNAILRGDIAEVQMLMETAGQALSPGMRQAATIAIRQQGTQAGGAKSAAELAKHLDKIANAQDEAEALRSLLREASTKSEQPIADALSKLEKAIRGHLKEVGQKWKELKDYCGGK